MAATVLCLPFVSSMTIVSAFFFVTEELLELKSKTVGGCLGELSGLVSLLAVLTAGASLRASFFFSVTKPPFP